MGLEKAGGSVRWWVVGWRRGCASQLCQSSIRYLSQPALPARTLNQGGQTSLSSSRTAPLALRHSTSSGPKRSRNVIRRQRDWAIRPHYPELVFFRLLLRRGSGSRPCPDSFSSRVRDLHSKPLGLTVIGAVVRVSVIAIEFVPELRYRAMYLSNIPRGGIRTKKVGHWTDIGSCGVGNL